MSLSLNINVLGNLHCHYCSALSSIPNKPQDSLNMKTLQNKSLDGKWQMIMTLAFFSLSKPVSPFLMIPSFLGLGSREHSLLCRESPKAKMPVEGTGNVRLQTQGCVKKQSLRCAWLLPGDYWSQLTDPVTCDGRGSFPVFIHPGSSSSLSPLLMCENHLHYFFIFQQNDYTHCLRGCKVCEKEYITRCKRGLCNNDST